MSTAWGPGGQPPMRIGDAEREAAAARLGESYAEGRLTTEEHSERLDAIWTAKTQADLDQLFWDLPAPAGWAGPTLVHQRPPRRRRTMLWVVVGLVLLSVVTDFPFWLLGLAVFLLVRKGRSGCERQAAHGVPGAFGAHGTGGAPGRPGRPHPHQQGPYGQGPFGQGPFGQGPFGKGPHGR